MTEKIDPWIERHLFSSSKSEYGVDKSRQIEYKFNSLGFRCEEPNPNAKIRIYVSGCSHTFGTGINFEDTWPQVFRKLLAEKFGIEKAQIDLQNFASGGQSNDYIVRTLISQSSKQLPDLILCYFTYCSRSEFLDGDEVVGISASSKLKKIQDFLVYGYTDEDGVLRMIKNILLLQMFCKIKNIPCIIGGIELSKTKDEKFLKNPVIAQYASLVDAENLFFKPLGKVDLAADGVHAGPKTNQMYAKALFENFIKIFPSLPEKWLKK